MHSLILNVFHSFKQQQFFFNTDKTIYITYWEFWHYFYTINSLKINYFSKIIQEIQKSIENKQFFENKLFKKITLSFLI